MRIVLGVIIGAFVIALINAGLSFTGVANLIWVVAIALFLLEFEVYALIFAMIGGFIFDVVMHGQAGMTSLSVLIGLFVYVFAKGLGVTDRPWQKVFFVIVILVVSFLVEAGLRAFLDGQTLSMDMFGHWLMGVVVNGILVGIAVIALRYLGMRTSSRATVKL